jgi:predicted metalloendopeptidase
MCCVAALAVCAACASKPPEEETRVRAATTAAVAPVSVAPAPKAQIGAFGLDLSARDLGVKPGDDFFEYANGAWDKSFTIPADKASFGPFDRLDELSKERVRHIIERSIAAHAAQGTPEQQIGDYYSAFMDEAAIEANGLAPAEPDLQRIAAAKSRADIARLFGSIGYATLFDVQLTPDNKDPNRYAVVISESSLGLPDRDYYLKDDATLKALREKYVAYIAQLLTLGGSSDPHGQAREIMAFETAVAQVQWPIEKRRDVEATYNPRTKAQLLAYAPGFQWQTFLDAQQLGGREQVVLAELTAMRDLAKLYEHTPVPTLKAFLTFHYLSDNAAYLPKRFDEARFAFYGQTMRGQPQQKERWKRAVNAIDGSIGEPVGRLYVAEYFPPESKAKMQALVGNLRRTGPAHRCLAWMTAETKTRAREARDLYRQGRLPDHWRDYSSLVIKPDDPIGNPRRASQWWWDYQVARIDKPVDRAEWGMNPQEISPTTTRSTTRSSFRRRSCSRRSSTRTRRRPSTTGPSAR